MIGRKIVGVVRLGLLLGALLAAALVLAPLQWLAHRLGSRLRYTLPVLVCRMLCRATGLRVTVHGMPEAGGALLVPNHVSWLDIPAIGASQPAAFIAKREVGAWPIVGGLARLQGAVFVDRSRRRLVRDTNRQIADRLVDGRNVVLFAEGTTGCGNRVRRFLTSHFEAPRDALRTRPELGRVTVQPVSIAYTRRNGLPVLRRDRASVAWYGDMTLWPHVWGTLTSGPLDCDIRFLPPIPIDLAVHRKTVGRETERVVRHATAMALGGRPWALLPASSAMPAVLIGAERS